ESRMMCAELVDVYWKGKNGRERKSSAILEDISLRGACLQFDAPLPLKTVLRIAHRKGELQGTVCYCVFREIGYFVGLEFGPETKWVRSQYQPEHMLDLRKLVMESAKKAAKRVRASQ